MSPLFQYRHAWGFLVKIAVQNHANAVKKDANAFKRDANAVLLKDANAILLVWATTRPSRGSKWSGSALGLQGLHFFGTSQILSP